MLTLGEAYAFGVVWSFVFMSMSMLVLRFKEPAHREYEVPLNIRVGRFDIPLGMTLIFLVLAAGGGRQLADEGSRDDHAAWSSRPAPFVGVLAQRARPSPAAWAPRRPSTTSTSSSSTRSRPTSSACESLNLTKPYRKLVAIRSPYNLGMLERCLAETDPETTEVVVMTASVLPQGSADLTPTITEQDRQLLTAVVNLAEHAGKPVKPVIVPTNEPFFALAQTAKTIGAQELIMGPSNKYRPEDQLDQVALYWLNVCGAKPEPLSIRVLGKDRDARLDIAGGSQIPKPGAAAAGSARILAELRKSWHGVERLLLAYDGSPLSADFLDTVHELPRPGDLGHPDRRRRGPRVGGRHRRRPTAATDVIERAVERARALGRIVDYRLAHGEAGPRDRPRRRRRQVRRDLHEPARRLSPRRYHRLRLEYPLRPRERPLPRHPRLRAQVDPRRGLVKRRIGVRERQQPRITRIHTNKMQAILGLRWDSRLPRPSDPRFE